MTAQDLSWQISNASTLPKLPLASLLIGLTKDDTPDERYINNSILSNLSKYDRFTI